MKEFTEEFFFEIISTCLYFVCETIGAFRPTANTDFVISKTGYAAVLFKDIFKT